MGNTLKYEAMGLSPLEKKIVMESWLALRRKLSICGQMVIIIFLEEHPEHLVHFPIKYRGNPDLAEILGLKVMREFSRIVSNLETLTSIASYMREVAINHQPRHINPKAFDDFRMSYLKMLHKQLAGHRHLGLFLQCWDKLLRLINTIVLDIIADIDKKSNTHVHMDVNPRLQKSAKYEPVTRGSSTLEDKPQQSRVLQDNVFDDI